jgi:hypothetical protein
MRIMPSKLIPTIMILVALLSLGSLFYITVPQNITSSYESTTTLTAINPMIMVDYSTSIVSCTGTTPVCFGEVILFTYTVTFSGQTTITSLTPSTSTSHVRYATSGTGGGIAIALATILLFAGAFLLSRNYRPNRPQTSHEATI